MSEQVAANETEIEPVVSEEDQIAEALAEPEVAEGEEDEAELEIGPDRFKVKKPIKEAWDGLQKSVQTRAEEIKAEKAALAAEKERSAESQRIFASVSDDVVNLKALDRQIEPYLKLTPADWMAWAEQDGDAARKAQTGLQAMLTQRQQLAQGIDLKVKDAQSKQAAAAAEYAKKAEAEVAAQIPGWSPAKKAEIESGAKAIGIPDEFIPQIMQAPWAIKAIQKAIQFDAAMAKVAAKKANANAPTPEPQPKVRTTGPRSEMHGLSDNVPVDTWRKNFLKTRRG